MAVPAARLILVLALLPGAPWGATAGRPACPRPCSCPQPVELHCTFRSLVAFPPGISNQVERINLGFNSIHKMTDRSLSGLKKLELLMVHGNALHSLPDGVFRDLTSLQMLKMSYNKLSQISRRTLQGLWSLARLHLDHNRLEFIQPDTFQGLTSLRVLQLEGNRLRQLHPATLTTFSLLSHFHVSTLRHLYLADNGLTSLHPGLLKAAPLLENLQLHGNPWSCDCHMSWLRDWDKSSPGVLKCKKDKDYPGGELCPMCSFPRHLQGKEVQALDDMVCSGPVITSPLRATKPEDAESEVMTLDKFSEPLGNITLGLSDEHGNKVDLECGVGKPRELQRVNWEQVSPHRLAANITWSVDLDCPIDRENYERLWRLIAYYSDVPAHLEREIMLSKEPQRSYRYRQDMERDAQYYTGVKVIVMAQPRWLMQASLGLRLNRPQSTGKRVKLVLSSQLSQSVETELERRRGRTWVMIESTNTTQAVMAAVVGSTSRMQCSVRSSGEIVLHWVMPDGSQLEVPHNGPNDRVSASSDGQLVIKSIDHSDMGIYYCVAKVHGDLDILPFRLVVEESSSPRPGDDRPQPLPIQYYTGESIALPCEASGSPNAEINWILPRRNIVSTRANTSRALVYSNGTLQVLQGQLSDSGYYKCIAINQHGMDTYATKVNVTKRATQTTMRTPRKFPKMPQSASGVRTKITVPTEESVDGSGDEQVMKDVNTKTKLDPVRRRGPISGRRVISHPSRNTWRRPPVPRKPAQPRVDARKTLVDARRRVNVASNKIDPRKWADILAKVRDRKVQNSVTPNTVQQTPESKRTDATADPTIRLQNNMEGSGEGGAMQEEEEAIHTTTPTPMRILSTTNYVSSTSASKHTTRVTFNMRTNTINQQQQQQPTSAPQSSLTRWQTSTNRAGIRGSVSHDESSQEAQNDGAVSRESVPEVSEGESAFPPDRSDSDRPPSPEAALQTFPSSTLPPITPSVETQRGSVPGDQQPALHFDKSPGSAHTLPQVEADVPQQNQSGHRHTHSQVAENELFVKIHRPAPLLPPPSAHAPTVQHEAVTSSGDHEPSGLPEDKLDDNHCRFNAVSSRYNIVKRPHLPHSPIGCHANHCFVNDEQLPENGPSGPNPVSPAPKLSDSAHPVKRTTTQTPRVIPSTAAATATAAVQTSGASSTSREGRPTRPLPAPTQDASRVRPRPVPLSPPRGNPWIMRTYTQTVTVNTETDAHLPCEAVGQPHPFLSWTKVSTGASIAQNMKVNRFEVHSNGTLVIRSAQPTDRGQYLCRVQSQHGEDQVTLNLVVLLQHPRVLQPRHRDVTVHQGTSVHLDCTVQGHPPPRITWVLPDQVRVVTASMPTVTSDRRLALLSNGTLRISRAGHGDRGVYRCLGSSVAGTDAVTVQLHVSAAVPPAIEQAARENTSLAEGASAFLHCTTTGAPPPTVHWTTPDGTQLPAAAAATQLGVGRNLQVFPNGTLQVRGATAGNAGWYECTASNAMAASRRTVFLSVHRAKPSPAKARISVSSPLTTDVVYGGALRLDCQATGDPEPRSVTEEDAGDFLCLARNRAGDDFARLRVDVLTRPAKIHRKRLRSSHQEEEEEVEEEVAAYAGHLRVDCVASGLPDPAITWALPDGTMLNADSKLRPGRNRRYVVFGNGTLLFNDVGMPEEGDYTCYAENPARQGRDEGQGESQGRGPAARGSVMEVPPAPTGSPAPVLSWISPTHRAIAPVPGKYGVLDNGTLVVHRVQRSDGGNYTCVARNAAGQSRKATALEVLLTAPSINGLQGVAAVSAVAVQGRTALVDCVAVGTPPPRVMWVLPGMAIVPVLYHSSRTTVHRNGTLELRAARRSDAGQLTCIARNEAGEARLAVNLSVREAAERPQVGGAGTESLRLTVGSTMVLNCSLRGVSAAHLTWVLPGGVPLPSGARLPPKFSHRHDGSLVISDPSAAEAGAYRCLGRHAGGLAERTVTVSPPPGGRPEIAPRYASPVRVQTGRSLWLHCPPGGGGSSGVEPLRLTWTLPSGVVLTRPQHAGRYAVLPNGTLAIRQASVYDRGSYVCRVANAYGDAPPSAVQVEVLPAAVASAPRITSGPPSVTYARRGVALQLNCAVAVGSGGGSAAGAPRAEVAWETPDRARLAVGTQPRLYGNKYVHPQGSLVIQNPTARDAGLYRCTARNAVGMDSKATYLNVF
ncbi:hypothetical protein CRUP_006072 [Coryphaenoides rupestris]|nr:hypothetical protein CRUP_006072 [Coryphaenoides rupestris]